MVDLNLIWARNIGGPEAPWLVDAWDEFLIDENPSGYREAFDKATASNEEVRVIVVRVEHEQIVAAFAPAEVDSEVVA